MQAGGAHSASDIAANLDCYLTAGGNPAYDVKRWSAKSLAHCHWHYLVMLGGLDFVRVGSVTGADKPPGKLVEPLVLAARRGWAWSRDPRFAWVIRHSAGREKESDAEWTSIERAAAQVPRAPWLDNRSRFLESWAGILESGLEHDDYRFRRAVAVRAGVCAAEGPGDIFDLNVTAHGVPMTQAPGQRSGYLKPDEHYSRIYNSVEVDGRTHNGYAWTSSLTDTEGAAYMNLTGVPPPRVSLYRRQVALVDVDEGQGSRKLTPEEQQPDAELPRDVQTANSYVFDVFRVSGGKLHTYCFHATVDDDFQWNARNIRPVEHLPKSDAVGTDAEYLSLFARSEHKKFAGDCPTVFEATWRMNRESARTPGSEQRMLGRNYDPKAPRKFTRLHVLGVADARALRADTVCEQFNYRWTNALIQRRGDEGLNSAFAALIEPYCGEPFITECRLLEIAENDADAQRASAVEVRTRNGHTDLLFADGRPERTRTVGAARLAAEFAAVSRDAQGVRLATLTGGTLLQTPEVTLKPAQRERTARVTAVDYGAQTVTLDQAWPGVTAGRVFEIGTPAHTTAYTSSAVAPAAGGCVLTLDRGADYYRSRIEHVDADKGEVECSLHYPFSTRPGLSAEIVASNEAQTKFWRAQCLGQGRFRLTGAPVAAEDFGAERVLRLWEYGVGDNVRQSTFVSLRRLEAGRYELRADVDVEVTLGGATRQVTVSELENAGGRLTWRVGQ